ncbi:Stabilin-1 [Merluccius polli]|uniref:Stabilin-1 n=1 Tax=Merluccius polli TaxID=89951 RepID=A0AA47P6T8_MERPO|nr:Stabilin-1 [Merluccius polli]
MPTFSTICGNLGEEKRCHQTSIGKQLTVHTSFTINQIYCRFGRGGERGKLHRRGGGGVGPEGAQVLDSSSGVERGVRCTGSGSQTVQGSAGGRDVRQAGVGTQAGSQTVQGSAGGRDVRQAGVGTQAGSQTDQGSAGGRDVRQAGVGTRAGSQTVAECCPGFYGPECRPCIGGFETPCYGRGQCSDGIHGNGSCSCHSGFKGVACHICSDPNKHGKNCDRVTVCVGPGRVLRASLARCATRPAPHVLQTASTDTVTYTQTVLCLEKILRTCVCADGYEGDGLSCSLVNPCLRNRGGCDANAQCVFASVLNVSCVCNKGWSGDGLVCVEINNCDLASRGGCGPDADCGYIGPAQSECRCKSGFLGDGVTCERIDPCRKNNGGCHTLAKCALSDNQVNCTCPPSLSGDGLSCYGSLLDRDRTSPEYLSDTPVTVFAPANEVWKKFDQESFWTHRRRISHFLQAHMLPGPWSVEDLEGVVGHSLPSLSSPTAWTISSSNGVLDTTINRLPVISVGNATILTANLPTTNGYIHIINQILVPPLSDLPPDPPTLMAFLNSSSNFTYFRRYALLYNLTEELKTSDFTLLLPTDDAVRRHLSSTNSTLLDPSVFRYHVLTEVLFPADLRDGMVKGTLLGYDFQLQFHLKNNQTLVNDALIDSGYVETKFGVVLVLTQVLKVQKNRCSRNVTLQINMSLQLQTSKKDRQTGRQADRDKQADLLSVFQIWTKFPDKMVSSCYYKKRVGIHRRSFRGCMPRCFKITRDHACCPGYYGHECFRCPGEEGSWCSNHGQCEDGSHGNGECRCYEGFHGTACEDCEPGRYGTNCSSKCVCDHGKCEDGLAGSGRCLCFKGWRGTSCSVEIKDDACGDVCDENANCMAGPQGSSPACVCAAGYNGNGTFCKETDLCGWQNGGCAAAAVCSQVSPVHRTCRCKEGFTGDGVVCLEVDGCLFNNGGCSQNAECTRTGPNTVRLPLLLLIPSDGVYLLAWVQGVRENMFHYDVLHQGQLYLFFNSNPSWSLQGNNYEWAFMTSISMIYWLPGALMTRMSPVLFQSRSLKPPVTVFVPDSLANQDFPLSEWAPQVQQLTQAHIVSCEVLSFSDLKTTNQAIALSGHTLDFTLQQGDVYINNRSRITGSDVTTDGIIHYVDKVLTPYSLENKTSLSTKESGLLPVLQMVNLQPFLMLWPTDEALQRLPEARKRWLSAAQHKQQLQDILEAHITRSNMMPFNYELRSLHGSMIRFNCNKNLVGDLSVNGARVVERFLTFKGGVAYGIDQLLEPPGLGAHCDGLENRTIKGRCGHCSKIPACRYNSEDTVGEGGALFFKCSHALASLGVGLQMLETLQRADVEVTVLQAPLWPYLSSWWPQNISKSGRGALERSAAQGGTIDEREDRWTGRSCCEGYNVGSDIYDLGGLAAPCGNHGNCLDGRYGQGACVCNKGFRGSACELCEPHHHGNNCTECECVHGRCDDGVDGSGECSCETGWYGELCQKKLDELPEECKHCHVDAECVPGSGCLCRKHFEGNGTHCSPMPDLCVEYNGGCHQNADCNQTSWQTNCSCHTGYHGDGYSCEPINRCIEELNGGCSDFANCKYTGPSQRQCECEPGYVGNGVQCLEKVVPPVDRCLEENGGCHAQASCHDLHYHGKQISYRPISRGTEHSCVT